MVKENIYDVYRNTGIDIYKNKYSFFSNKSLKYCFTMQGFLYSANYLPVSTDRMSVTENSNFHIPNILWTKAVEEMKCTLSILVTGSVWEQGGTTCIRGGGGSKSCNGHKKVIFWFLEEENRKRTCEKSFLVNQKKKRKEAKWITCLSVFYTDFCTFFKLSEINIQLYVRLCISFVNLLND